jgi:hypothetical protein
VGKRITGYSAAVYGAVALIIVLVAGPRFTRRKHSQPPSPAKLVARL